MPVALTRELGRFIAEARYQDIPKQAIAPIHTAFADTVCVMVAGAREPAPQLLKAMLAPAGDEAVLVGGEGRAGALDAAWINGTAAHVLDFDDIAERGGHISGVLVAAILAEAEAIGATGEQMVLAYGVGYETIAELVRRDADQHHDKGWHPTPVFGAIGAAAACASLRDLDAEKSTMAIALSASQSCGVMSNVGTMTKSFHTGRAAHAGVASARLAASGFTAAFDGFEHAAGFLAAVSPAGKIDVHSPVIAGSQWQICGANRLSVKKYPLCFFAHRAVDGMLDLLKANEVDPESGERVTVTIGRPNAAVLRYHAPQTGLEAKFSMEFAMACALIARRLSLAEFTDGFVRRDDVQALMKRVVVMPDDREDPRRPGYAVYDQVVIETRDGRRPDSGPITKLRGSPDVPLKRDELWTKFESALRVGNARIPSRRLFDALMSLDRLPYIRELVGLMVPAATARASSPR